MWEIIIYILLVLEGLLFLGIVGEWLQKKKHDRFILFLIGTFVINFAVYLIPYIYAVREQGLQSNHIMEVLACATDAILSFVGEGESERARAFADILPIYGWAYAAGFILALIATVNTAMQAFSYTIRNRARLFVALRKKNCDIVLGTSENALRYAKDGTAVIIPEDNIDKDGVMRLLEQGYIVLRRSFSKELLKSSIFNSFTSYNIVCPENESDNLEHIETFISYRKSEKTSKKIHLFIEMEGSKAAVIRKEIIDKSCCPNAITTYCSNELLARRFTEEHPLTEYLPRSFFEEDTSIKRDVSFGMIYLGFGPLNREMYRQSVLNNQFVIYDNDEYKAFPVNYHLFDTDIDQKDWIIDGLKDALEKLQKDKKLYFPLPELPYNTTVYNLPTKGREILTKVEQIIVKKNSFYYVIVDVGNTYQNIEIGNRLRKMLGDTNNYHIFIRSESAYTEDDARITYLGDIDDIFTHEVIVNDALSQIAYKYNEIYTSRTSRENLTVAQVEKKAEDEWKKMNYFTRYSNLYAALNIRLKLQLLGLDYLKHTQECDNKNAELFEQYYPYSDKETAYNDYLVRGKHNAILAQEKYRWNVYHLLNEVMPMPISEVKVAFDEIEQKYKGVAKNNPLTKHACITTFKGLDCLSGCLAEMASQENNTSYRAEQFSYYQNDEQLLKSITDLMAQLGYTIIEKEYEE